MAGDERCPELSNDSNLSLLDDDICNVVGLDLAECVPARQAGSSRAAVVTVGEDATLTYQGLCIQSVFGGAVTFEGLSSEVLSDIAVIKEDTGLFEDDPHWSTNDLAADKRNPFGTAE